MAWIRRAWGSVVYVFAALGVAATGLGAFLYLEGQRAEEQLDPKAPQVYREFARRLLAENAASASVIKVPLAKGVSVKEAAASMESRAAARNVKLVGRLDLRPPVRASKGEGGERPAKAERSAKSAPAGRGGRPPPAEPRDKAETAPGSPGEGAAERPRHMEVLQFCDTATAMALLEYNADFLAHMPCSVGLYEDAAGQGWLVTLNLDLLIHGGREIDPELKQRVLAVKEALLDIMAAGAAGAL